MTIEVRQLVVRSSVGESGGGLADDASRQDDDSAGVDEAWLRRLRAELLDECRRWIDRRMGEPTER